MESNKLIPNELNEKTNELMSRIPNELKLIIYSWLDITDLLHLIIASNQLNTNLLYSPLHWDQYLSSFDLLQNQFIIINLNHLNQIEIEILNSKNCILKPLQNDIHLFNQFQILINHLQFNTLLPFLKLNKIHTSLLPTLFLNAILSNHYITIEHLISNQYIAFSNNHDLILNHVTKFNLHQILKLLFIHQTLNFSIHHYLPIRNIIAKDSVESLHLVLLYANLPASLIQELCLQPIAFHGHLKCLNLLLMHTHIDCTIDNQKILSTVAAKGHHQLLSLLLNDQRFDPTIDNNYPIMWSSYYGHYETVQLLLAQLNVNPSQNNNFAIRNAFKNGHLPVVNLLFADPRLDRSNIPTIVDFMNNNTTIPDPSGTRTQTNDLTSQTNDTQPTELFATIRSKISSSNLIPNLRSQISNLSIRSRKRYSLISLFRRNATDMEDLAETDTDESTDLDECSDAIDTETTIPPVNLASNNIPNPHTTIPSTTDILDDWVSISASDIQSIPQHTGIDCGACSPELQMCGMDTLLQDTTGEDVCVMETEYIPSVVSNQ